MKRFLLSILFFVGVVSFGFGQTTFNSTTSGNWNDGATWGNNSPGIEGTDWPSSGDDVVINSSHDIVVPGFGSVACRNIRFPPSGNDVLELQFFSNLTVNGTIYNSGGVPSFRQIFGAGTLIFTGNSTGTTGVGGIGGNDIIALWNSNSPFPNVEFNLSSQKSISNVRNTSFQLDDIIFSSGFILNSGTLQTTSNQMLSVKVGVAQSVTIDAGATLNMGVPLLSDDVTETRINQGFINGTLALISTAAYANFVNLNLGSSGLIRVGFTGANQQEGWWFQNIRPVNFNSSIGSEISFSADADQNVLARNYSNSNLSLQTGGVKTLIGTGALTLTGDLNIAAGVSFQSSNSNDITIEGNISNSGIWTTSQIVNFAGTNNQIINGSNPIIFGEEVRIEKSSGNVTLQLVNQTIDADLRIVEGTFRPLARTVTLSGNIINDGIIEATQNGTGGFVFDGTTEISGNGTTQFRNITINGGASLTQELDGEFEVTTNFTNNGTFTHNDGSVRFRQSGTKSISGSATTTFYDLSVEGGTVNVNGTVDLENIMTFTGSPTIDFDGSGSGDFTLKSTQTRDASIANVGTATLNGELNAERAVYTLRGDNKGYHIIGFPVDGATVGEVQNSGFAITGNFTGASITGTQGDGFASIFGYDQSAAGDFSNGYTNFPGSGGSTASQFVNGDGYFMFTYEGDAPGTITTRGTVHTGEFAKSLPYTANGVVPTEDEGWHMVANPFPSATNWDLWDKSDNIELDAWLWDPSAGAFVALVDGQADVLPQGQGFFIRSLPGAGSITVDENAKVSTTTTFLRNPEPSQIFKVGLDNGDFVDYTYIGLKEGASFDYNGKEDASRLLNNNETISTKTSDGKSVKVNRIPFQNADACGNSIFINLEQMVNDKDYTLKFENVSNLSSKTITLYDHYLDQTIDLNITNSLQFTVNADADSKGSTRFEILIDNKRPNDVAVAVEDICPSENAVINIQQSDDFANYLVYQGEKVVASAEGTGTELSIEVLNEFLVDSSNSFEIKAFAAGCDTVNVGNASIQVFETLTVNNTVEGSSICKSENQAMFSLATQINASYFILNGADTIQSFEGNGNVYEGVIESAELEDGVNQFIIAASKDGCQNGTLTQTLEIEVQNPIIDESVTFLSTNTCFKTPTDIIFVSQAGVEYQIFKGTTLIHTITGDGSEQTVEVTEANLSFGLNEFTVSAQYGECAQYEFPEPIQIEVEENINTNLSLLTENTCGDENTSIVIENAQIGKIYTLQSAGENISSLTAQADGELVFNLNTNQVNQGLNEFDIQIEGDICDTKLSTNQAVFTVYEPINSNLEYLAADICSATEASVGITNAQEGKIYKLYNGETLIESITASSDGELIFANANNELVEGVNTFNLKIEGEGCGEVDVEQNLSITLFESINPNLDIISPDVCFGDQVNIEITNPQVGKTYNLMASENILATEIAENEDVLSFSLPSSDFGIGYHALTVDIIDDNCGALTANQTVEFELFDSAVIAEIENQNVCKDESVDIDLSANVAMGSYQLYVGDELISEVTNSTLSLAPLETTTYTLTGIPENGCSANTVNFTVEVTDLATPGILVSNNVLESSVEGDSYQWYINGEILEGETGKVLVAQESGDYTVQVNRANCAKISDAYTFSEEVLNANKALANAINLYPNPVVDLLSIDMGNINEIEITIYTLSGKFMDKMSLDSKSKPSIDMSKFSEGTYLIQLTSGKGSITKRIIKK